jgi:tetratricopeptide (TPR) repeat protein
MSASHGVFPVQVGSPFAVALAAARSASDGGDAGRTDVLYRRLVTLVPASEPRLRTAIAAEHVARLRTLHASTTALARCEEYLADDRTNVVLRLLRVETDLVRGDHSRVGELTQIRRTVGERPEPALDGPLSRLEGLVASRNRQFPRALERLRHARTCYVILVDHQAVAVIDTDIRAVRTREGTIAPALPASGPQDTPAVRFTRSEELRLAGRYEEALEELQAVLDGPFDPAQEYHFLGARVRLLRLLRDNAAADRLMAEVARVAHASARPAENEAALALLDPGGPAAPHPPALPEHRLPHVRRLVRDGRLDEAERLLLDEREAAEPDDRLAAEWHLAAGELRMAIADRHRAATAVRRRAVAHFAESVRRACTNSISTVQVPALRGLGHAHAALGELNDAVEAWAAAHRIEEAVANLQPSDRVRLRMLHAVATEFDVRIQVAAAAVPHDPAAVAAVVVAMEAARGGAIVSRILPGHESLMRDIPAPSDRVGAVRWVQRMASALPRDQVVWMLHATPSHVHHAFLGRGVLRHVAVASERSALIGSIDELAACWRTGTLLGKALTPQSASSKPAFDLLCDQLVTGLGLHDLPELPRHVRRIAVVAGDNLAEVPFALLPAPGSAGRLIGREYALSDLPCLSVRQPLRLRSLRQHGLRSRMLLLSPDEKLQPAEQVWRRKVLMHGAATSEALRDALAGGRYRHVRIDSHASFDVDPSRSGIDLAGVDSGPVQLRPHELRSMNLGGCGTLILGACETGMATRIGRDERDGFVRAAMLSGVSAVLASRWQALDVVAKRVLDGFERYLRNHPRDVALFLALRDEDNRDHEAGPAVDRAHLTHPARWGVWCLYGDTGYQARCGPVRRALARLWSAGRSTVRWPR